MADLREVQIENLRNIMERDAKLDNLMDKVDMIGDETHAFKAKVGQSHEAVTVRKKYCWEQIWVKLFMSIVGVLLLYIIVALFCGFDFGKCS